VQILSTALPGFRDLRAPAIAGYVWLLFAWVLVRPDLEQRPAAAIAGSLYDLAGTLGKVGTAVTVSVAAYLIGATSQEVSRAFPRLWRAAWHRWQSRRLSTDDRLELGTAFPLALDPMVRERIRYMDMYARIGDDLTDSERRDFARHFMLQYRRAEEEFQEELALPATLLVGEQEQLFAEVDRLRAEGELRMAVTPPLMALVLLLGVEASPWWFVAVPALVLLFLQGIRREDESRRIVANAVDRGTIQSSGVENFREWAARHGEKVERRAEGHDTAHPDASGQRNG
jgi:hypothetical protein